MKRRTRFLIPILTIASLVIVWFCILLTQHRLTVIRSEHEAPQSMAFAPQSDRIKPYLMGFNVEYANYLWIRTTLYFGAHFLSDQQFKWLTHLVDLVTELNPDFYPAYEFAGLMIPDICKDPDAARVILARGLSSDVANKWKLWYYLGMIYYRYYGDDKDAAECIARAASEPNTTGYRLAGTAAALFKKAGAPEEGMTFLRMEYLLTEDPHIKQYIRVKMEQQR